MVAEVSKPRPEVQYKESPQTTARRGWWQRRFGRVIQDIYTSEDTNMSILAGGRAVLDATKNLITTAQHHSYTQTYTIEADLASSEVYETFKKASRARPQVKYGLLVDHFNAVKGLIASVVGNKNQENKQKESAFYALNDLNDNGHAQVVVTNEFNFWDWKISHNALHRNHQKAASADGERAIVSSANIGDHHLEWVDGGIYLEGPAAQVIENEIAATFAYARGLKDVFQTYNPNEFWRRHGPPSGKDLLGAIVRNPQTRGRRITIHQPNGEKIQLLTDSFWSKILVTPDYQEATHEAFTMVRNAQKGAKVDIFTPYPGIYSLTKQMKKAVKNGAEVTLHIPKNCDYPLYNPDLWKKGARNILRIPMQIQMNAWRKRLKRLGIHLVEFEGDNVSKGMIHLKAIRVQNLDQTGSLLIGSPNFGKGLISHWNREMAVKVENKQVLSEFDVFMESIMQKSRQIF